MLKEEIRARILDAALEIFAARGFTGATMGQLAERAGLATGALYRYYPGKQELCDAVVTPEPARLLPVLQQAGATVTPDHDGAVIVSGIDNIQVATLAAQAGVMLHELTPKRATLEDTFMELTHSSVEYRTDDPNAPLPAAPIGAAR